MKTKTKKRRSPRLNKDNRRLIETLAAFANLKPEDVAAFRGGVLKLRNGSANLPSFLPDICWELPAPSPPPGSSPLPEGLLGWQEIQQLVQKLWDSTLPFPHESLENQLKLYCQIAALPTEEREALRLSIRDPFPPAPGPYSPAFADWAGRYDHELREESRRKPYSHFNYIPAKGFSENDLFASEVGPPREPRADEYLRVLDWVYAKRLRAGEMPSEHAPTTICPCERAVWFMTNDQWRAKICRNCSTRYIALEQQRRYCSNVCSRAGRRASNRPSGNAWWHRSGKEWRKKRDLKLREHIRKMSDTELRKYVRAAAVVADPKNGKPNPALKVQLDEARLEWKRRHPRKRNEVANIHLV
jgi:hypothetical protein